MSFSKDTLEIPLTNYPHSGPSESGKWDSQPRMAARSVDSSINESTGKAAVSNEDGTVNAIGRIYQAIYNFSIVTRYMIYVFPVGILIAIPIIVGATAARDATIGDVHLYWFFAWFEIVWVSLWVCKIFAKFIPHVFQTLCGFVSSGTRKYALILSALETPITLVLWAVVSLVTFFPVMTMNPNKQKNDDEGVKSWEKTVKNILFALLVCTLIYLAEKAIVQLISISYHRKQFDTKIKESKHNISLVGLLFNASREMFPTNCEEFREEDYVIFDSLLAPAPKSKRQTTSLFALRTAQNVGRFVGHHAGRVGDKFQTALGNVASELTGKQIFNSKTTHSIIIQTLENDASATALARRLWMSFVVSGAESLVFNDFKEVLGKERETEAEQCFAMLDKDGNGDISLQEMILAITELGHQRKALNHSMHDVDQAITVLDNLLMGVSFVVGVLVFISFVTSGFGTVIAAGVATLLSVSFVFATTAQEVLGSCIFLFVKHPFDIGDRIEIFDKAYVVERISLLFSVFRTVGDHRITQVSNSILNNLWIDNMTRANAMHEQLSFPIALDTSFAEIEALRNEMELFVVDKANSRDFQPEFTVEVLSVGAMDKLELRVKINHKSNWSNESVRAVRRSKFMCALILAIRKIKVRAPGVAAPTEESKNEGDGDDDGKGAAALKNETEIAERLNFRSAVGTVKTARDTEDNALHPAASNSSHPGEANGMTSITRGPSTGCRRAGTRASRPMGDSNELGRSMTNVPSGSSGTIPFGSSSSFQRAPGQPGDVEGHENITLHSVNGGGNAATQESSSARPPKRGKDDLPLGDNRV